MEIDAIGFDEARLERITDHLVGTYVKPGKIAGCQALVARNGHVAYFRSFGHADLERGTPVRDDTIWRIYSMTKPITSVALMTLYEEARFQLGDPVHRFIPEWKGMKVCEAGGDEGGRLIEPDRPVTVRDLLTHTAGLTYGTDPNHPVDRLYAEAGLRGPDVTLEEFTRRLGGLPLKFHPGTRWHYSLATDVCGRLVEILADRPFDEYLREAIFEPLGMVDTGFVVPHGATDRFAACYRSGAETLDRIEDYPAGRFLTGSPMCSGGGGLVSTTADYLRFAEMLRRDGELDGRARPGQEHGPLHAAEPPARRGVPVQHGVRRAGVQRHRIRSRLRGHGRPGREAGRWLARRLLLGRRGQHDLLGRPRGAARRYLHDAAHAIGYVRLPRPARTARAPGHRGLTAAGTPPAVGEQLKASDLKVLAKLTLPFKPNPVETTVRRQAARKQLARQGAVRGTEFEKCPGRPTTLLNLDVTSGTASLGRR